METVTFKSKSKHKINLLIQIAKEMGVKASKEYEVTDEDMAIPGGKYSKKQVEKWLAKDDGKSIPAEEVFAMVKEELVKYRKSKERALTDEEMGVPGTKFAEKQFDEWLAKDDGDEEYSTEQVRASVKAHLAKSRKKRAA